MAEKPKIRGIWKTKETLPIDTDLNAVCNRLMPRSYFTAHGHLRRLVWSYYLLRKYGYTLTRWKLYIYSQTHLLRNFYFLTRVLQVEPYVAIESIRKIVDHIIEHDIDFDWDDFIKQYKVVKKNG